MTGPRRVFVGLTCTLALAACGSDPTPTPSPACPTDPPTSVSAQATLEGAERATVKVGGAVEGEFAMELYGDQAPIATANFVALARCGFYDGITFHRVISGFVIQAGDPQTKENRGDFEGLGTRRPRLRVRDRAAGATASATTRIRSPWPTTRAPTAASSSSPWQTSTRRCARLACYTIFGKVIDGTDVVDAIAAVPVNDPQLGLPLTPVIIESITISAAAEASQSPGE